MTARDGHLRDARLKKALDSAPDQPAVPAAWARLAIRNAAQWPAATPAPVPWWRRIEGGGSGARAPWNAAFATVLLAGFVTVLWQGQEVPDATPDRTGAEVPSRAAPAAATGSAALPASVSNAGTPAAARPAPMATAPAAEAHRDRRAERERATETARAREDHGAAAQRQAAAVPLPAPQPARPVFPQPAPVPPELAAAPPPPPAAAPVVVAPAPAVPAVPVAAPAMADNTRNGTAGPSAGFAAGGSVARPAARARESAAMVETSPQAPTAAKTGPVLLPPAVPADWAEVRITVNGLPPTTLPRARSGALQQRLQNLLAGFNPGAGNGAGAAPAGGSARVELLNGAGDRLAVLTVDGAALRWVVESGGAERATLGRAEAAALEALRAELERLSAPPPR